MGTVITTLRSSWRQHLTRQTLVTVATLSLMVFSMGYGLYAKRQQHEAQRVASVKKEEEERRGRVWGAAIYHRKQTRQRRQRMRRLVLHRV